MPERCPCCGAHEFEQRPECASRQRDALAGGIRSMLGSLPFVAPEALAGMVVQKLAGAMSVAGLPIKPDRSGRDDA